MPVEIRNLNLLARHLNDLSRRAGHKRIKNKMANFLMTKIKERTLKGYDVHGDAFEEYSPKYELFRQKKGLPTYIVDLFFTGSMMASMTYEVGESSIRLFFQPTKDKTGESNPAKAYWLHQDREFFSLSFDEISEMTRIYEAYIEGGK